MDLSKMECCGHLDHNFEIKHQAPPYACSGCWQVGFYTQYQCSKCSLYLHKECAQALNKPSITHDFFPGCIFFFLDSPVDPQRYCDACGLDIKGYNYHCFEKGWDLHPSCASLPFARVEGDMMLNLQDKLASECDKCGKKKLGNKRKTWCYVSSCRECHLHVACVKDMLLENLKMEMHTSASTALVSSEPKLHIVLGKGKKRSGGKFGRYLRILKLALSFIMSALVGDPTALVAGVIFALFNN